MNLAPHTSDELLELASSQLHEELSADKFARLETLLQNTEERKRYLHYMFLHAHLTMTDDALKSQIVEECLQSVGEESPRSPLVEQLQRPGVNEQVWRWSLFAASASIVAAIVAIWAFGPPITLKSSFTESVAQLPPEPKFIPPAQDGSVAKLTAGDQAEWADADGRLAAGSRLRPGTVQLREGNADITFHGGAKVQLRGPTMLGVESSQSGSLFAGKVLARIEDKTTDFSIQTKVLRIVDLGTEFGIQVNDDGDVEVHCFEGEIETQSLQRLPRFYWSFDEGGGPVVEQVNRRVARSGTRATRVPGLVGSGAMHFDNTKLAYVNLGNGGGTQIGSGDFGVSTGITIEALIVSEWSGTGSTQGVYSDYEEIFRKDDGPYRILLSLQNDDGAKQRNIPAVTFPVPTLSFGLHLTGDGYSELEIPLDGKEGRPKASQLCDGKTHHIVATYDSWTGVKSLYIDGVCHRSHAFPKGTLIISGGPSDAYIGNTNHGAEPFTGIIDEVALYDFSLTNDEITGHWANAQAGRNYFGLGEKEISGGVVWKPVMRILQGTALRFDGESGMAIGEISADRHSFSAE